MTSTDPIAFETAFDAAVAEVERQFAPHGFVPHPAYPNGAENGLPAYQFHLASVDCGRYLHQLRLAGFPRKHRLTVSLFRSGLDDRMQRVADIPRNKRAWAEIWLRKPFVEFTLLRRSGWPFAPARPFFLTKERTECLSAALPHMIAALYGPADPKHLRVAHVRAARL